MLTVLRDVIVETFAPLDSNVGAVTEDHPADHLRLEEPVSLNCLKVMLVARSADARLRSVYAFAVRRDVQLAAALQRRGHSAIITSRMALS